jgi:hypothetical protein
MAVRSMTMRSPAAPFTTETVPAFVALTVGLAPETPHLTVFCFHA